MRKTIPKQSGDAFLLKENQLLKIIDPQGKQVCDMVAFNAADRREKISAGKSMDFEESIHLTTGNFLWSNRSQRLMEIMEDTNGLNDFLLNPCCLEMFHIVNNNMEYHPSCFENLANHLAPFNIGPDEIPTAFNVFMNVQLDDAGKISILPPLSKAGDYILFRPIMDLIIGLTACSDEATNGGEVKPIQYEIFQTSE